jgi:glycosyltransferase involved in cell wall biosynthesis
MYKDMKVVVIMPAYNAAQTLKKTYDEVMEQDIVDLVIVVDDCSQDETVAMAQTLPRTRVYSHKKNTGYGGNQKTCYKLALEEKADIVIMVHPDYQYTPKLIPAMASMIGNELYHCVVGSRILGGRAITEGMPIWRYVANRFLTLIENLCTGAKLSEYHSGYRAFSGELLRRLRLDSLSDDFILDNQLLAQILWLGYSVGEVSCPTRYTHDASSINFWRSVKYGFGCLYVGLQYRLARFGLHTSEILKGND